MAVVNKFNVNNKQVTLDADIIENMSANDVSYNSSLQYGKNTVGDKLSELESNFKKEITKITGDTKIKIGSTSKTYETIFLPYNGSIGDLVEVEITDVLNTPHIWIGANTRKGTPQSFYIDQQVEENIKMDFTLTSACKYLYIYISNGESPRSSCTVTCYSREYSGGATIKSLDKLTTSHTEIINDIRNDVNSLVNNGYKFGGVIVPTSFPLQETKEKIFYIATENGIYENFGGVSVSNEIVLITEQLANFVNLLEDVIYTENSYIDKDGIERGYNGWRSSDFIEVKPNTKYRLWYLKDGKYSNDITSQIYAGFYASDKSAIGGETSKTTESYITTPNNVSYIRISSDNTYLNNDSVFVEDGISVNPIFSKIVIYTKSGGGSGIVSANDEIGTTHWLKQINNAKKYDANDIEKNVKNLVLLHFSDLHNSQTNLLRIVEYRNFYSDYIDDTIHTGDSVNRFDEDTSYWNGANFILNCIGNHDSAELENGVLNWTARVGTDSYNKYFKPYINEWGVNHDGNTSHCYYYKDYAEQKIRLIVVDCMIVWDDNDSEQYIWLRNTLTSARQNNYDVIIGAHFPAKITLDYKNPFNSLNKQYAEYMKPMFLTIVDEFINAGGRFICWLTGHQHRNSIGLLDEHPNQFLVCVSTASKSNAQSNFDSYDRGADEKSKDLFNLVVVDSVNKRLTIKRVGADVNYMGVKCDMLLYDYNTKQILHY